MMDTEQEELEARLAAGVDRLEAVVARLARAMERKGLIPAGTAAELGLDEEGGR